MKYVETKEVFQEFPDEITLAISISGCPNRCPGCHSSWLVDDIGEELDESELERLVNDHPGITCVGFLGGDGDPTKINQLARWLKQERPELKVGWYTGKNRKTDDEWFQNGFFDYIKVGPYIEKLGGLDSKETNQRMWKIEKERDKMKLTDITSRFWK